MKVRTDWLKIFDSLEKGEVYYKVNAFVKIGEREYKEAEMDRTVFKRPEIIKRVKDTIEYWTEFYYNNAEIKVFHSVENYSEITIMIRIFRGE